ncbi:VOC family protein [Gammaproteobacteria bacterium]|jgi:catechol 2,3-dioxygenase-like lactoylglutathione lyase family enzyme|nr:VOC family protein [Gammaproteobacteria bacterium]MDB4059332.1 VOC family protein [Gammaproteobacteria bacterium]MDC1190778.1 VOC family protein [Gammaproteobacteria bacterium]
MFSHVMLGANDIEASKIFYDKTMAVLGSKPGKLSLNHDGHTRYVYFINRDNSFLISQPIDGQVATDANGSTIGFNASSTAMIDEWHAAGIEAGAETPELCDPPGIRDGGGVQLYLAYLRDPSGNKICAMYRIPR